MSKSAYEQVLAKYDWAKKHVEKLEAAVEHFRLTNPHSVGRKDDIQTGRVTFYIKQVPAIPEDLAFSLGDAIHNLRSTLDHLAYALIVAAGGLPHKHASFPVCDIAEGYKALSRSKLPGLNIACYQLLDRVQPYRGGRGHWLWQLHQLDIVDKHRLLLTICTRPVGRTMTPNEKAAFTARRTLIGPLAHAAIQYTKAAESSMVPLQAGFELATFAASEVDENMGFAFDIAVNEPGIVEGTPSFLLLRSFSDEILRIINDFRPCL